jgi:hypothetical protein
MLQVASDKDECPCCQTKKPGSSTAANDGKASAPAPAFKPMTFSAPTSAQSLFGISSSTSNAAALPSANPAPSTGITFGNGTAAQLPKPDSAPKSTNDSSARESNKLVFYLMSNYV